MKKGLKIAAITVGVIIILMFLLPFAFQGKIADIVKTVNAFSGGSVIKYSSFVIFIFSRTLLELFLYKFY